MQIYKNDQAPTDNEEDFRSFGGTGRGAGKLFDTLQVRMSPRYILGFLGNIVNVLFSWPFP